MQMESWAPVDFCDSRIPIPAHPVTTVKPFALPLRCIPEYDTVRIKPSSCFIWMESRGEFITYDAFHEWDLQMKRQEKQVCLDEYFNFDADKVLELRLQHASYGMLSLLYCAVHGPLLTICTGGR